MFVVQFTSLRAVEYADRRAFEARIGKWLTLREAENSYLLGELPRIAANPRGLERLFTLEEGEQLVAAGILFGNGGLCMTWASEEMIGVLATFMVNAKCRILSILAPGHVSWFFAKKWAELTDQRFEFGRDERIYQLARCTYAPSASGRLDPVTQSDRHLILPWINAFIREAEFELGSKTIDNVWDTLAAGPSLFLWKDPQAVSMAAFLAPTPNGGSINFVYTPPEYRGRGYAKTVVAALAQRVLSSGRKYCFILTDTQDVRTHRLYQSVGARTLCELLRCTIHPKTVETSSACHSTSPQKQLSRVP